MLAELEPFPLAFVGAVEDGALDFMAAVAQSKLELSDEGADGGSRRPRIHLRDEQDAHGLGDESTCQGVRPN